MSMIIVDFLLGRTLPSELVNSGASGCTLVPEAGLIATLPTTGFLPSDFEAFRSRPCTLSLSRIHQFAVGLEFRFNPAPVMQGRPSEPMPLTTLFVHSPVVHQRTSNHDILDLITAKMLVHFIAYDPGDFRIVGVRRGRLNERITKNWRKFATRQLQNQHHFNASAYEFDVGKLMEFLPQPLPSKLVRSQQVLPPPDEIELVLRAAGCLTCGHTQHA